MGIIRTTIVNDWQKQGDTTPLTVLYNRWINCIVIRFINRATLYYTTGICQNTRMLYTPKTSAQLIRRKFKNILSRKVLQTPSRQTLNQSFGNIYIWLKLSSCILQLINIGAGSQIDYPTHEKTVQSELKIKILHTSYSLKCYKLQKFQLNTANK